MRTVRRPAHLCLLTTLLSWAIAGTAVAADWRLTQLPMPDPGAHSKLLGISCPSPKLCVAVGETGVVATSTDPDGGASAWQRTRLDVRDPSSGSEPGRGLQSVLYSVSCPTLGLCVAVTFDGFVAYSTDPTGGSGAWRFADVDGSGRDTHLLSVSCPTAGLCVAVSGERHTAGKILTSTDPTGGPGAWSELQLDETLDFRGVSCGTPNLCVAVAENGRMLVSSDPTGGSGAWREIQPGGPGDMRGVSCVGTVLCVAGNFGGNLLASANPLAGESAWNGRNGGGSVLITGVSCLPSRRCLAVDNNGSVLTSSDPLDPGVRWTYRNLIPFGPPTGPGEGPNNAFFSASCPALDFCALAGSGGSIYTSTDAFAAEPSGGGGAAGPGRQRGPKRPRTKLAKVDRRHTFVPGRGARMRFRFYALGKARGFECRLDRRPFRRCRSPKVYRHVPLGRHVFRVRAIGTTGLRGPVAEESFRIVRNPNAR